MKISLIVTILNEEDTIEKLLFSFLGQTLQANEIIIVDGGSIDKTIEKIKNFLNINPQLKIKLFTKKGNRSVGRNLAVKKSQNKWIAITDAGCILHKNWLEELANKQQKTNAPVIAGYYAGLARSNFEKAVIPYVLVMPDKIDENNFLPATRSMMIHKKVWEDLGGFDENLSDNEDYVFAKKIQSKKYKIAFAKKAVVDWLPCNNLSCFSRMIFRFARGDTQAGIWRSKVIFIFLRYLLFGILVSWGVIINKNIFYLLFFGIALYMFWSIQKNIKHARNGWYWLPVLQITSDVMVMVGSVVGVFRKK